jgi:uncharacterized coiled-coil protein SlyX
MRIAEATVTLSDSTVGAGDTVVLSIESDFAFAVEDGAYAEGYLVSDTDVVYGSAYIYVPIDGVGALAFVVPEYAVPGSYTAVISYWDTSLESSTYEWPLMEFAVTVVDTYTVDERIAMLEANVSSLAAALDVQATDIAALQAQLDEITAEMEGMNATLSAQMADEIAALQERIDALEASNAELSDSVDTKMESMLGYVIILLVVVVLALALMNMMMIRKGSRPPPAP